MGDRPGSYQIKPKDFLPQDKLAMSVDKIDLHPSKNLKKRHMIFQKVSIFPSQHVLERTFIILLIYLEVQVDFFS